jgi:tight adherence protein B
LKNILQQYKHSPKLFAGIILLVIISIFFSLVPSVFAQGNSNEGKSIPVTESREIILKDIDTNGYPNIDIYLNFKEGSPLGLTSLDKSNFKILENNNEIKDLSVKKIAEISEPIGVVLVIDTSGSMKGKPIGDAVNASRVFMKEMRDIDKISIVGFSDNVTVYSHFTSERQILENSIAAVTAKGETSMFDGIVEGINQFKDFPEIKHRYLIVLSDGKDTVSVNKVSDVISKANESDISIYSIALQSTDFDPADLNKISGNTGGELMIATKSEDLVNLYKEISKKIRNQYKLTFKSLQPKTDQIQLQLTIKDTSTSDSLNISYKNPFYTLSSANIASTQQQPFYILIFNIVWVRLLVFAFLFGSVTLFLYILATAMIPVKNELKARTDNYLYNIPGKFDDKDPENKKQKTKVFGALINFIGRASAKRGFSELFEQKMKRAGISMKGSEFISIHIISVILITIVVNYVTKNLPITLVIAMVVIFFPFLLINFRIGQRIKKFNEQLPDTLQLIEGSLKAGYSLNQSIAMVVNETKPPMSDEFKVTLGEIRMGLPENEALDNMALRINSDLFEWVVMAINIQKEVGGNLAEVMDIIANTIREKDRMMRQIKSLTAEGKLSAYVLIGLPIILALVLSVLNRDYISVLFTSSIGIIVLIVAAILMISGVIWILKIVKIDY